MGAIGGGGFLVVPALVLALGLPMGYAVGISLVVITITSASALVVRAGTGINPSWGKAGNIAIPSGPADPGRPLPEARSAFRCGGHSCCAVT